MLIIPSEVNSIFDGKMRPLSRSGKCTLAIERCVTRLHNRFSVIEDKFALAAGLLYENIHMLRA